MPPETGRALLILVMFVLPGFVTLTVRERTHELRSEDSTFERLLQALYYSVLTYSLVACYAVVRGLDRSDLSRLLHGNAPLGETLATAVITILVVPVVLAYVSHLWADSGARRSLLRRLNIREAHRIDSAWDYFFRKRCQAFIRVTLRDGGVIGGYYGSGSFAGYGKQSHDLYLEQQWSMTGDDVQALERPVPWSAGIWVPASEIILIEVYAVSHEQAEAIRVQREDAHREEGRIPTGRDVSGPDPSTSGTAS